VALVAPLLACSKPNEKYEESGTSSGGTTSSTTLTTTTTSTTTSTTTDTTTTGSTSTSTTGDSDGSSTGEPELFTCGGAQVLCHLDPVFTLVGVMQPTALASGPIRNDMDEFDDIAVVGTLNGDVQLLVGDGTVTFMETDAVVVTSGLATDVDVANVDDDEDLEIFVGNHNGGSSTVTLVDYDGTNALGPVSDVAAGNRVFSIVVDDFVGNADLDLAYVSYEASEVLVAQGNGDLTFSAMPVTFATTPDHPQGIAAGDFDKDGNLDFAVGHEGGAAKIYFNDGADDFMPGEAFGTGDRYRHLRAADLDGDTFEDLLVTAEEPNEVHLFVNNGDGTFAEPRRFTTGTNPTWITTGDVNDDGFLDFAVVSEETDVRIWAGSESGQFVRRNLDVGSLPGAVVFAEVNGDDVPDIVVSLPASNEIAVFLSDPQPQ
jgi:hypothetical protein